MTSSISTSKAISARQHDAITASIPTKRTPERLSEWLREEIRAKATRFELGHFVAGSALATPIEPYDAPSDKNDADELARAIFERASAENEAVPLLGGNAYQVTSFRAERAGGAASMKFRVMPTEGSSVPEGPNAEGIIRQNMRHLEEREDQSSYLLLEAVSAIHTGRNETGAAWKEFVNEVREQGKQVVDVLMSMIGVLRKDKEELQAQLAKREEERLNSFALVETLTSEQHKRELETLKATRKEDRTDKAALILTESSSRPRESLSARDRAEDESRGQHHKCARGRGTLLHEERSARPRRLPREAHG